MSLVMCRHHQLTLQEACLTWYQLWISERDQWRGRLNAMCLIHLSSFYLGLNTYTLTEIMIFAIQKIFWGLKYFTIMIYVESFSLEASDNLMCCSAIFKNRFLKLRKSFSEESSTIVLTCVHQQ